MVRAGEIEQYAYCAHNWWLARQGHDHHDAGSVHGMEAHKEQSQGQQAVEHLRDESRTAMRWMGRIVLAATSATFLTLEVIYLRANPLHWIFLTTALVLASGSAAMLTIAIIDEKRAERRIREGGMLPGQMLSDGAAGQGEVMTAPTIGLRGSPDMILQTKEGPVPVELKTGRTPDRPHDSHKLQLAAYLYLLEDQQGRPPPYGLLQYPGGVFRVAWDSKLRADLLETIDKINAANKSGVADRDHHHKARCRGCARRKDCDQSLA